MLSRVRLFATPWTVARQAPLFTGFSRQESLMAQVVKNPAAVQKTWVQSLGWKKSPGDVFSLAWEIPWTEEPGELQSMGSKKSQTQLSSNTFILVNSFYSKYWLYICFLMILFISYSKDIHFLLILGTFYFAEKRQWWKWTF